MEKKKKIFRIVLIVLSVAVLLFAGVRIYLQTLLPEIDGELRGSAVTESVTITRDSWGVPHITANNEHDAYYALGYTVAQDRLFQMELQRRLAKGELAEILGPELLETDKQFRTYLFRHTAEKMVRDAGEICPESLECFEAFLDGVNYFVETGPLPVEFKMLGIKPEKFTPVDSASFLGYMNYSFTEGILTDSLATIIKQKYPEINTEELFPGYTREEPVTIMESQAYYNGETSKVPAAGADETQSSNGTENEVGPISEKDLTLLIKGVMKTADQVPVFTGSNSWVIGPSRSESGSAILANDPHVVYSNPGVWYEAQLKYPGHENYGYYVPLVPFPFMAHNSTRGWAITMFENDDLDLYAETFKPGDDSSVMYKGDWAKVKTLKEKIKVKGGEESELVIRITPHGPVITDFIDGYSGKPLAMWTTFSQVENPVLDFLYLLVNAKDITQFEQALSMLAAPGLNVSYVDSTGNIAWWAVGRLPVRPPHMNSKIVLDGASGRDEYLGFLPFEENPHLLNPESGIIITANNLSTSNSLGPIRNLEGYWMPSDRAARITELLSSKEKWSLEDMKTVQNDVKAYNADWILKTITGIVEKNNQDKGLSPLESSALEILKEWDCVYNEKSAAPSLYEHLTYHVLKEGVGDEFGEENFKQYGEIADHWNFFKAFIQEPESKLWDNVNTDVTETREEVVMSAFRSTVAELEKNYGSDIKKWTWGDVCKIEYIHPIGTKKPFNLIFNIGPYPVPGGYEVINIFGCNAGEHDFNVKWGPSTRRLIDYADVEHSFSILPTGNSGNFLSPYYSHQADMYLRGEYRGVVFTEEQIQQDKNHELVMIPK